MNRHNIRKAIAVYVTGDRYFIGLFCKDYGWKFCGEYDLPRKQKQIVRSTFEKLICTDKGTVYNCTYFYFEPTKKNIAAFVAIAKLQPQIDMNGGVR